MPTNERATHFQRTNRAGVCPPGLDRALRGAAAAVMTLSRMTSEKEIELSLGFPLGSRVLVP